MLQSVATYSYVELLLLGGFVVLDNPFVPGLRFGLLFCLGCVVTAKCLFICVLCSATSLCSLSSVLVSATVHADLK